MTKLSDAIESRVRKHFEIKLNNFFGLGKRPIHKAAICVLVKEDEDEAIKCAYIRIKELVGDDEQAANDPDLLNDTKVIEALFRAFRRCEEDDKKDGYKYPAFPGPEWMRKNLTTDQVATLLHLYTDWRRQSSEIEHSLDPEHVLAVSESIAANANTDLPEAILAGFDRDDIVAAFSILSVILKEVRDGVEGDSKPRDDERDTRLEAGAS